MNTQSRMETRGEPMRSVVSTTRTSCKENRVPRGTMHAVSRRRAIITLLVFLALGAMVNIAVAWWIAWRTLPDQGPQTYPEKVEAMQIDVIDLQTRLTPVFFFARGAMGVDSYLVFAVDPFPGDESFIPTRDDIANSGFVTLPQWISVQRLSDDEVAMTKGWHDGGFVLRGFGLPARSMATALVIEDAKFGVTGRLLRTVDGIRIADRTGGAPAFVRYDDQYRVLPLRPIWPGFLINTLLYATTLWVVCRGPFALRRAVRRRRGLCANCGYPVGASPVCTECGRAVRAISVVKATR